MFRSLYTRFQDELQPRPDQPDRPLDWPATYGEGLVAVQADQWALEIGGLVDKPRSLSLAELKKLSQITQNRRLVSADGWTVRTEWGGISLQSLVEWVRPAMRATLLRQENLSGHVEFIPLADCLKSRALLCFNVSGKPLPALYGGPLRLLVFDRFSYKGLGQLARLDFVPPDQETPSYWEQKGYAKDGQIEPGKYYAFDLKKFRPVPAPGEVTIY
jgi:DMSO/TMAO reductase YedYZ molybdopterin-dependent catalytic subunit